MNSSAVTTVGHWNILVLAARCSQDWKIPRCPLLLMFDLIRSAARLFLIGCAGAVLGLAGFILSVLAYVTEAMSGKRLRKLATDALVVPESTSPPRDRDLRTRKPRMSQTRHDRSKRSSDRPRSPKSPRARLSGSGPRSPVTSSSPSHGPETPSPEQPEQQRPGRSRRRRSQGPTREIKSVDDVVVTNLAGPAPKIVTPEVTTGTPPPWRPQRSFSDVSSSQSSEISARRLSLEDHSPISGRRVFMKIKDSHSQLRERCLIRVQSMPPHKSSARPLRTDPYQAPYFFPSPMSPEAATYIQDVVNERQGTSVQPAMNPDDVESNTTNAIPVPSPPRVNQDRENTARPNRAPSPSPSLPTDKTEASPSTKRHRWSLHLPHLPLHHHAHDGVRLVDGNAQEKGGTTVHKELFSRLKFGHHRRRHGIGSADSHLTVSSAVS
ncbi:hypothetical protein V8D89_014455 [Ganoderma adspersum]